MQQSTARAYSVAQALIEARTDSFLHRIKSPSDSRIIDAKQSCSRRKRSSPADGENVTKVVPF
jgi:hypothetical protein